MVKLLQELHAANLARDASDAERGAREAAREEAAPLREEVDRAERKALLELYAKLMSIVEASAAPHHKRYLHMPGTC